MFICSYGLQYFDAVGWAAGRASGLYNLSGGVLALLSVSSEVQTCIWPNCRHCHSLSLASVKSRLFLPFWYPLTRVVQEIGLLNVCVCAIIAYHGYHAWYMVCGFVGVRCYAVRIISATRTSSYSRDLSSICS